MTEPDLPSLRDDVARIAAGQAVCCVLDGLAVFEVSGQDAPDFLHGQVTADLKRLRTGEAATGAYCTPKGRVLATFGVLRDADGFRLVLPRSVAAGVAKRLTMYVLRSKVAIRDVSESVRVVGVGNEATHRLAGTGARAADMPPADIGWIAVSERHRLGVVPAAEAAGVLDMLAGRGFSAVAAAAWAWLDIDQGFPWIVKETQDIFTPHMLNLDLFGAVSFEKGCYPGQEIVARTHYLGRVKRRMYRAHVDGDRPPQPGDPVYGREFGDQAAGNVVSAAPGPRHGWETLAVMQTGSAQAGTAMLGAPDGPPLHLLDLPYAVQ